jgi:hypothetical protein
MSGGCGSWCRWCGGCTEPHERDYLDTICPECGAEENEPHDADCGQSETDEDEDTEERTAV